MNSSQDYELRHIADKMNVSIQQVIGAKRATGPNNRKDIGEINLR